MWEGGQQSSLPKRVDVFIVTSAFLVLYVYLGRNPHHARAWIVSDAHYAIQIIVICPEQAPGPVLFICMASCMHAAYRYQYRLPWRMCCVTERHPGGASRGGCSRSGPSPRRRAYTRAAEVADVVLPRSVLRRAAPWPAGRLHRRVSRWIIAPWDTRPRRKKPKGTW